jgi:hypothetical protein
MKVLAVLVGLLSLYGFILCCFGFVCLLIGEQRDYNEENEIKEVE